MKKLLIENLKRKKETRLNFWLYLIENKKTVQIIEQFFYALSKYNITIVSERNLLLMLIALHLIWLFSPFLPKLAPILP